ncbi:hypothetical protein BJD12_15895 [Xanthomonas vesicatoria ATCC 35937]|nr:hypothetical protein BJD12_15895 [Xanthomonas vesicatoria ATCC 35937]
MDAAKELTKDVLAACPAMVGGQGPFSKRQDLECAAPSPLVGANAACIRGTCRTGQRRLIATTESG